LGLVVLGERLVQKRAQDGALAWKRRTKQGRHRAVGSAHGDDHGVEGQQPTPRRHLL
jgi:hypothetical protein